MKRVLALFLPFFLVCAGMAALAMWLDGARTARPPPAPPSGRLPPMPDLPAPPAPAEPGPAPEPSDNGLQVGAIHTNPDRVLFDLAARGNGAITNLVEQLNAGTLTPLQVASNLLVNANDPSVQPVDPLLLRDVIPEQAAGFTRGRVTASTGGGLFMKTASAAAVFRRDDGRTVSLKVMDTGSMRAVTLFARDLTGSVDLVQTNEVGLVRTSRFRGHALFEKYGAARAKASAHLFVHDRFYIQAEGRGVTQEDLRALLEALDLDRLPAPGTPP